ncbi:tyrosine-type recombinase/integrase [Koleobacter methoxysyntrophicus]|uniref:tyrosine-type recombinase/integrase n=1 Tax=Koleobacter methoxysyntrophicus TaxID=2751313 RepID=UPI0019D5B2F3|nr:tyrosine-type recombinase/integrase [Koleobacter methoxysyntrophicus]
MFQFVFQDFLDDRKFRNLSPVSITDYRNTFTQFHDFLRKNQIIDVEDITPVILRKYLIYCQEKLKNKPSSINHKIRNLKTLFNYLVKEEIINLKNNPCSQLDYLKEDVKIETFNDYHIRQMLNYCRRIKGREKTFYACRLYVMIIVFLGTGIRSGELCNLRWRDVDFVNSSMTVIGKVRKQRTISLVDRVRKELSDWRIFKDTKLKPQQPEDFVFSSSNGKKLSANALKCIFKRLKTIMNFRDVNITPHVFRHTFAKYYIVNGGDPFTLKTILGHSSLEMTLKYVRLFGSDVKEKNEKYNVINNMDLQI